MRLFTRRKETSITNAAAVETPNDASTASGIHHSISIEDSRAAAVRKSEDSPEFFGEDTTFEEIWDEPITNDDSKLDIRIPTLLPTNYIPTLSSYNGKQSPKKRVHRNPDYHPGAKTYKRPLYNCRKPSLEDAYLQPSNQLLPLQKKTILRLGWEYQLS